MQWPSIRSILAESTLAPPVDRYMGLLTPVITGPRLCATCPLCSQSRYRPCHDSGFASGTPANAGASEWGGEGDGGWTGHPALRAGCAGGMLSHASGDDP